MSESTVERLTEVAQGNEASDIASGLLSTNFLVVQEEVRILSSELVAAVCPGNVQEGERGESGNVSRDWLTRLASAGRKG